MVANKRSDSIFESVAAELVVVVIVDSTGDVPIECQIFGDFLKSCVM